MKESLKLYQGATEEKKKTIWILEENEREDQWLLEGKGGREIVWNEVQVNKFSRSILFVQSNLHATDSKVKDNVCNNKNNRKYSSKQLWQSYVKMISVSFQRGILFEKCQPYTNDAKSFWVPVLWFL